MNKAQLKFQKQVVMLTVSAALGGKVAVAAEVWGGMAVHPGIGDVHNGSATLNGFWCVSNTTTGLCAGKYHTKKHAKIAAQAMQEMGIGDWESDRTDELTADNIKVLKALDLQ